MNVPMYLRDEEREMGRLLEEKEERWRREGLMGSQTALGRVARMQENVYAKKMADIKHQMLQNAGMSNQGVFGGAISGHNVLLGQQAQNIFAARPQVMHPDPNTMPEMQMSLDVAYNMWLVRFGDMWVSDMAVRDADGFKWGQIASRLKAVMLMEHLTNTGHYRLVPHVWK